MAVTTEYSDQLQLTRNNPSEKIAVSDVSGKKRIAYFSFTQGAAAGDANSVAVLAQLPAGRVRIIPAESFLSGSAFGASRTLDVGYQAYTAKDGSTVNADVDAFIDGRDVASATGAVLTAPGAGADPTYLFETRDGLTIQALVLGGTIPAGATLKGYVTYVTD